VGADERLRLFCALRLPDDVLDTIARWQARELSGGRLVPREHLHLTLAFLGSRPARDVEDVVGALRAVEASGPMRFSLRGYRETRTVGMLVLHDETRNASLYADRLGERLEILGVYEQQRRPWLPHVSVLRFRNRPGLRPALPDLGECSPSDAALYNSVLRSGGAQYDVLESVALGG